MGNVTTRYRLSFQDAFGYPIVTVAWTETEIDEGTAVDMMTALLGNADNRTFPLSPSVGGPDYQVQITRLEPGQTE
jgi:hypothetical protein